VLSTLCPGLGQVYNGQVGKGASFFLVVLIGLGVLCWGIMGIMKAKQMMPGAGTVSVASESASVIPGVSKSTPVEMNEDGVVAGEEQKAKEEEAKQQAEGQKPQEQVPLTGEQKTAAKALAYVVLGALVMVAGGYAAVKDAIRTARRKNEAMQL
jgi:TM2 domain-containing membrane protein YozV